jgi:alkanesulfonate monooxygenase SsuD/methylene tetrahydromethanopterin reductase-like flavin-dependent oxidoreductase (luciferase family)
MEFGLFGGATAKVGGHGAAPEAAGAGERLQFSQSDDSHGYRQLIDGVVEAERLGFHSIFLVEHHFTGSAQISASLNLLTYLAARTSRIRLGTAVVVVPWHNPVLLAEQAATVDVLSNGRLDFGVGKGYRPNEFQRFCIPLEEATERFEESIGLIKKALTADERFSHHSTRWHFEDIIVEPPPVQRPHPPMWLAAGRPDSIRKAAEDGYSLLLDQFATFELTLERLRVYREAVEAAGRRFDPMNVGVARGITIVRNEEEREQALGRRMASLDRMNRLATTADRRYVSSMASDPNLRQAAENGTLIGTPDEIIAMIQHLRDGGVGYILLSSAYVTPGLMQTFAEEIMPAFA